MTTRNRKGPGSPGPKLDEWDPGDPFVQIVRRRQSAIRTWAERQPHEQLAEQFTDALSLLLLERNVKRRRENFYQDALRERWTKSNKNRPKDDPMVAIKAAAQELWPTANRRGWTATQFHTELVAKGHAIPYDTARKWLSKLRKTGTC